MKSVAGHNCQKHATVEYVPAQVHIPTEDIALTQRQQQEPDEAITKEINQSTEQAFSEPAPEPGFLEKIISSDAFKNKVPAYTVLINNIVNGASAIANFLPLPKKFQDFFFNTARYTSKTMMSANNIVSSSQLFKKYSLLDGSGQLAEIPLVWSVPFNKVYLAKAGGYGLTTLGIAAARALGVKKHENFSKALAAIPKGISASFKELCDDLSIGFGKFNLNAPGDSLKNLNKMISNIFINPKRGGLPLISGFALITSVGLGLNFESLFGFGNWIRSTFSLLLSTDRLQSISKRPHYFSSGVSHLFANTLNVIFPGGDQDKSRVSTSIKLMLDLYGKDQLRQSLASGEQSNTDDIDLKDHSLVTFANWLENKVPAAKGFAGTIRNMIMST